MCTIDINNCEFVGVKKRPWKKVKLQYMKLIYVDYRRKLPKIKGY